MLYYTIFYAGTHITIILALEGTPPGQEQQQPSLSGDFHNQCVRIAGNKLQVRETISTRISKVRQIDLRLFLLT